MAAPTSCCRLKLTLKITDVQEPQTLWHSVDYGKHKTVACVINNLRQVFQINSENVALYIEGIIVPSWELCSHIFRDNESVELRELNVSDGLIQLIIPNCNSRKRKLNSTILSDSIHGTTESSAKDEKKKRKMAKKLQKEKIQHSELVIPISDWSNSAQESHIEIPPTDATQINLGGTPKSKAWEISLPSAEAGQNEEESEEEEKTTTAKSKRSRSTALTPIEQQLIAELETLPKPKKHRTRSRKKSKKATELKELTQTATTTAQSDKAEISAVTLRSNYQGIKKVFDSDADNSHDDERINPTLVPPVPLASEDTSQVKAAKKNGKGECFSTIQVKNLISSSHVPPTAVAQSQGLLSASSTTQSPNTTHDVSRSSNGTLVNKQKETSIIRQHFKGNGPVVFKREKLKLRATISPAVLQHLASESLNESSSADQNSGSSSKDPHLPPIKPSPSSEKKIKWHKNQSTLSSTPKYSMSKEEQLSDIQTNISNIHHCDSPNNSHVDKVEDVQLAATTNKDYTVYPNLDGPPRVGDVLAFKRLEVSADYTPTVSEYKEGVVINYEPQSKMVHVKLTVKPKAFTRRNGVFDVHIEEGEETLTNVNPDQEQIVDILSNLLEPRLVTTN